MAENKQQNGMKLSHEDIKDLMANPNADTKIKVLEKLSGQYNSQDFTESQVRLAEQIFRLLMRQAEIEVRKALSESLMSSKIVPHDVVFSLARDVEEVALPILEFSDVLTDEDLIEIINSTEKISSNVAIAKRNGVSESVSSALVGTGDKDVVDNLLNNDSAKISDSSFEKVIASFASNEKIVDSMITRGGLSNKVVENMTQRVSSAIQKRLENKYEGSFADINIFFRESGEMAALKFMSMQPLDKDLMKLVDELEETGKLPENLHPVQGMLTQLLDGLEQVGQLTPLSSLANGHQILFEISLSRLTGVPFTNVRKLLADREGGMAALYDRAQLPPKLFDAVRFILDIVREMNIEAKKKGLPKAHNNLYLLMKNVINLSKGQQIRNLAHFISTMRDHIEKQQGEW